MIAYKEVCRFPLRHAYIKRKNSFTHINLRKFLHCKKIIPALSSILIIIMLTVLLLRGIFPLKHSDLIEKYCHRYCVDRDIVLALIKAESNFSENAVSHASAKGLMQLTESTFFYCMEKIDHHVKNADIFDPEQNIHAGVWYLSFLLDKYNGNIINAVAAYNAGLANVDNWLASPKYSYDGKNLHTIPFGETERHVSKIIKYKKIYSLLY